MSKTLILKGYAICLRSPYIQNRSDSSPSAQTKAQPPGCAFFVSGGGKRHPMPGLSTAGFRLSDQPAARVGRDFVNATSHSVWALDAGKPPL